MKPRGPPGGSKWRRGGEEVLRRPQLSAGAFARTLLLAAALRGVLVVSQLPEDLPGLVRQGAQHHGGPLGRALVLAAEEERRDVRGLGDVRAVRCRLLKQPQQQHRGREGREGWPPSSARMGLV